jgi:hypothetical protein
VVEMMSELIGSDVMDVKIDKELGSRAEARATYEEMRNHVSEKSTHSQIKSLHPTLNC